MHRAEAVFSIVRATLLDPKLLDKSRRRKGAFTRNCGKLPYWTIIKLLMSNIKRTIAATLDEFFTSLSRLSGISISETPTCSQQAFSKARSGIDHKIFYECFERVIDFLFTPESHDYIKRFGETWGIQIIGIDGSKIPLPNRKILLEKYGGMGRDASSPTAIASIAYDALNEFVLEAEFATLDVDERTLAIRHLQNIRAKNRVDLKRAMFVFDRGYASEKMIRFFENDLHSRYLFRLKDKFNVTIDNLPKPENQDDIIDQKLELYPGITVRVLRFYLPSGILETLLTNDLFQKKESFKELYFLRWPTEEEYKLIKVKVGLTCFRGYSENSILQEFWISMLLTNLANVVKTETDPIINHEKEQNGKAKNHKYKTNMNELIGALSRHLPYYLDAETTQDGLKIIKHIFEFLIKNPVVDKKGCGESNPRKEPRKVKNHYNVRNTH